jgi:hypothetical protein
MPCKNYKSQQIEFHGDVALPFGLNQFKSLIFRFATIYYQKRFNDRSNGFPFWQQPV